MTICHIFQRVQNMNAAVRHAIKHWGYVIPYTHIPRNQSEYKKLLYFVDELMEFSRHSNECYSFKVINFSGI